MDEKLNQDYARSPATQMHLAVACAGLYWGQGQPGRPGPDQHRVTRMIVTQRYQDSGLGACAKQPSVSSVSTSLN